MSAVDPWAPWRAATPLRPEEVGALQDLRGLDVHLPSGWSDPAAGAATLAQRIAWNARAADVFRLVEAGHRSLSASRLDLAVGIFELSLRVALARIPVDESELTAAALWAAKAHSAKRNLTICLGLQRNLLELTESSYPPHHTQTLAVRGMLAQTLLDLGDMTAARELQEETVRRIPLNDALSPSLASGLHNDLAATLMRMGDLDSARRFFVKAEQYLDKARAIHEIDEAAAATLQCNIAKLLFDAGDYTEAHRIESALVERLRRSLGAKDPLTVRVQASLAVTLSRLHRDRAALGSGRQSYEETCARLGRSHPESLNLGNNGATASLRAGRHSDALDLAVRVLQDAAVALRSGNDLFAICANCLELTHKVIADPSLARQYMPLVMPLARSLSAALSDALELRHSDSWTEALNAFKAFHNVWFKLCIHFDRESLVQALAPLHGLEAWSAAIRASGQVSGNGPGKELRHFVAARETLQQRRGRLASTEAELSAVDADIHDLRSRSEAAQDTPAALTTLLEQRSILLSERASAYDQEREALARYAEARETLATRGIGYAALSRAPHLSATELAETLNPGDGLVITFDVQPGMSGALLVVGGRPCDVVPLENLGQLDGLSVAYAGTLRSNQRHALRDAVGDRAPGLDTPLSLGKLQSTIHATFWMPLCEAFDRAELPTSSRLHIVTGPTHHRIPLNSAEPNTTIFYYCGLPAYFRLRDRPAILPEYARTDVMIDSASSTESPIPFVEVEAQMIERLRGRRGSVVRRSSAQMLSFPWAPSVALCCHGATSGASRHAHGVLLLDAAAQTKLDSHGLVALSGSLAEVWVSACLGGLVASSAAGDALGLVSELQVRGVGAVIACRAPVQDWFMPAFSSLYWYFRLDDLIPADALLRAKRVFESRSWPENLRDDLRTAYAAQMDHILLQARYRPEGVETDDAAERSRSLMASIAGWALPSAVRSHYFADGPAQRQRLTPVMHEQFSKSFCERSTRRKLLINGCLDALLSGAKVQTDAATQAFIQQAIAHLCAMTVCFGGAQHPLRASRMPSSPA